MGSRFLIAFAGVSVLSSALTPIVGQCHHLPRKLQDQIWKRCDVRVFFVFFFNFYFIFPKVLINNVLPSIITTLASNIRVISLFRITVLASEKRKLLSDGENERRAQETERYQHVHVEHNVPSSQRDDKFTDVGHCSPQNVMSFSVLDRFIEQMKCTAIANISGETKVEIHLDQPTHHALCLTYRCLMKFCPKND